MMQKEDGIESQVEFLLSAALQKCGNIYDAEDLAQETLLAALSCLARGKTIQDIRAWLLAVLNRKFNDMLRRKYRQPTVSIGDNFEIADEAACDFLLARNDEASQIRESVAHLAKIYREVIVRHYMDGQDIAGIAAGLGIPKGTVKSRLYLGRSKVKERMCNMEKYTKQSYSPVTLYIANSGTLGRGGEPISLVNHDLMAQNILWLAYAKPLTVEEISDAIGIPTAYVEPVVEKLVNGELMKKIGTKYYTDFLISTMEDEEKYIPDQKQFVQEHFDLFWDAVEQGLSQIRKTSFYKRCGSNAKHSLELYVTFRCLDHGLYRIFLNTFHENQIFPDRPDGGRWIAFGHVYPTKDDQKRRTGSIEHSYSGERFERLENYAGTRLTELHVYDAEGFPARRYDCPPENTFFRTDLDVDVVLAKLLCLIHTGTDPESVGFNIEYLKVIPWLVKCKILREENGKPAVNIPILDQTESKELWEICSTAESAMADGLKNLLAGFYRGRRQEIPPHLDSVPLQKQYLYATHAMLFATVREAIKRGRLHDGNYDDPSGKNQPPCPMVLVLEQKV